MPIDALSFYERGTLARTFTAIFSPVERARDVAGSGDLQAREPLAETIDDLPLIHWIYDGPSERLVVNDAFCEFLGASEADLRAGRWRELLHPDDADGHIAELLDRVGERQPFHGEARFKRADGEWRWLESWARPRISESGEFCGLVGISTDVTDRKLTETELRLASEERLMLGPRTRPRWASTTTTCSPARCSWDRRVRELWGIGPDEPVTYAMFIAGLHPEDIPKIGSAVNRALNPASDGRYVSEYRVINPRDGRERWVLATGRVVFERGRAVRLVGTIQDISERKQAEAALRASEERLRESDRRKDEYLAMLGHELRNPLAVIHNATELLVRSGTKDPRIERISEVLGRQSQHMTRLIDGLLEVSRIARGKIQLEAVALGLYECQANEWVTPDDDCQPIE
ncbi:MAG: PAS domain-containing protein [Deltaproteobacteria bacterium]|nr:PAS domain-containing protein [Deltaproteobacteria bacterium]